jgi:putative glutamine amidotransferase
MMSTVPRRDIDLPIVLLPACNTMLGGHPFHVAGRKYVEAVRLAGALPMVVPRLLPSEVDAALAACHGLLLTGSPSNVHPSHFDEPVHDSDLPLDPERDAWVLPLIRVALSRGVPLLGICRGTQEVNVALGGSLHQAVQEAAGHDDHRADRTAAIEVQYGPSHDVEVQEGGRLAQILGPGRIVVNSVHGQGVKRLAAGLRVEAVAPDGLIEAFSATSAPGFNLCVQWHPEWQAERNPVSGRLFEAFGAAVRQYRDRVRGPLPPGA